MEESVHPSDESDDRWCLSSRRSQHWSVRVPGRVSPSLIPTVEVEYDAARDEKEQHEAKMRKVQEIEKLRKEKEAESKEEEEESFSLASLVSLSAGDVQVQKKDNSTFAERMQLQVIRNLELSIRNLHIVYEDKSTKPGHPFAMGITLNYITLHVGSSNESHVERKLCS